jgi:serine/threonine protein kinase
MKRIIVDIKDEKQNNKNMNEIQIFKDLNHPNLIKYLENFIHKDKLCIVMEHADGGKLNLT